MPQNLDECVRRLIQQGYTESEAWAICQASLYGDKGKIQVGKPVKRSKAKAKPCKRKPVKRK